MHVCVKWGERQVNKTESQERVTGDKKERERESKEREYEIVFDLGLCTGEKPLRRRNKFLA